MSGGAMNYIYSRFDECADMVEDKEISALLKDLGELLHDEEWYESCDYSREQYLETLDKFKKKWLKKGSREERLKEIINEELDHFKERLNELV